MAQIIAGTYEILEEIGAGGGGIVYRGRHLRLGKTVVLKADKRTLSSRPEALRREVVRLAMLADDGLDGGVFAKAAQRLEEPELLELRKSLEARAAGRFPAPVQLRRRDAAAEAEDAEAFRI